MLLHLLKSLRTPAIPTNHNLFLFTSWRLSFVGKRIIQHNDTSTTRFRTEDRTFRQLNPFHDHSRRFVRQHSSIVFSQVSAVMTTELLDPEGSSISEFRKALGKVSMDLQRRKPEKWNVFLGVVLGGADVQERSARPRLLSV